MKKDKITLIKLDNKHYLNLYKRHPNIHPRYLRQSLGLTIPKEKVIYVRMTPNYEQNKDTIHHEFEELLKSRSAHEIDGVRYGFFSKVKKWFRKAVPHEIVDILPGIGGVVGGMLGGPAGAAAGAGLGRVGREAFEEPTGGGSGVFERALPKIPGEALTAAAATAALPAIEQILGGAGGDGGILPGNLPGMPGPGLPTGDGFNWGRLASGAMDLLDNIFGGGGAPGGMPGGVSGLSPLLSGAAAATALATRQPPEITYEPERYLEQAKAISKKYGLEAFPPATQQQITEWVGMPIDPSSEQFQAKTNLRFDPLKRQLDEQMEKDMALITRKYSYYQPNIDLATNTDYIRETRELRERYRLQATDLSKTIQSEEMDKLLQTKQWAISAQLAQGRFDWDIIMELSEAMGMRDMIENAIKVNDYNAFQQAMYKILSASTADVLGQRARVTGGGAGGGGFDWGNLASGVGKFIGNIFGGRGQPATSPVAGVSSEDYYKYYNPPPAGGPLLTWGG